MKKIRMKVSTVLLAFALVAGVNSTFTSCSKYDDTELKGDVSELNNRVGSLETWQKQVNNDINSLKSLLGSVEAADYITGVTQIEKNGKTGYEITFKKSASITIYDGANGNNGNSGTTGSIVGIEKGDNGRFYWTVDGKLLTDGEGKKVPTTGIAPQMRINPTTKNWEISADNGVSWEDTGMRAVPESGKSIDPIFAPNGVDISSAEYVGFTLADGTTFQVPRYRGIKIGTDAGNAALSITSSTIVIPIQLPAGLKESDYSSMIAEVKTNNGSEMNIQTRSNVDPTQLLRGTWVAKLDKPTVDATTGLCNNDAKVRVYLPASNTEGEQAILEVALIDANGAKIVASRVLVAQYTHTGVIQINEDGTLGFWTASNDVSKIGLFRFNMVVGFNAAHRISNLPNVNTVAPNGTAILNEENFAKEANVNIPDFGSTGNTLVGFNEGKGDPCRLVGLSVKDINSGKRDNGVWRTPTADELSIGTYSEVTTPARGIMNEYGMYLPAAGTWTDKMYPYPTSYWSSERLNDNYGITLTLTADGAGIRVREDSYRNYVSVRCVRQ